MASLLKQNARKPIIEAGTAIGSVTWSDGEPAYRIDVYPRNPGDHQFSILLNRGEMLQAMSSWIDKEARDESERRRRAAKAA